jgi:adenylosuccinate synthase
LLQTYTRQYQNLQIDVAQELEKYRGLAARLKSLNLTRDTVTYLNRKLRDGKSILVEGANGCLLDIDFGTYPFVTSSNSSIGGVQTGLGLPPHRIGEIYGVVKAYQTRVGAGAFPTEQTNDIGRRLQDVGHEYGVTTGRPRRCGWLDVVLLRYVNMINGFTAIAVTKLDVLDVFDEVKIGVRYFKDGVEIDYIPANVSEFAKVQVEYETLPGWQKSTSSVREFDDLPENAKHYILRLESLVGVPVKWIGVGKDRASLICR